MTLFEQFKAFAKAKPRDEEYNHEDNQNCAIAQFAKSVDPLFTVAGYNRYWQLVDGANQNEIIIYEGRGESAYVGAIMCSKTWGVLSDKLEGIPA